MQSDLLSWVVSQAQGSQWSTRHIGRLVSRPFSPRSGGLLWFKDGFTKLLSHWHLVSAFYSPFSQDYDSFQTSDSGCCRKAGSWVVNVSGWLSWWLSLEHMQPLWWKMDVFTTSAAERWCWVWSLEGAVWQLSHQMLPEKVFMGFCYLIVESGHLLIWPLLRSGCKVG